MTAATALQLTERQFQDRIVDLARRCGWLIVHHGGNQHRRAYYDTTGFPDLLMIHDDGRIWFREIKTDTGKLTARQQQWQERLTAKGADVDVWRPEHWPDIVAALSNGQATAS